MLFIAASSSKQQGGEWDGIGIGQLEPLAVASFVRGVYAHAPVGLVVFSHGRDWLFQI